jgi:hypothetical protein
MIAWETVRHQVAIAGRVTDHQTGQRVAGARVEIAACPAAFTAWLATYARQHGAGWAALAERPDRATSEADGHFHFMDLPDGQYTLVVSLAEAGSRYGTAQAQATVSRTPQGRIILAAADVTLPPTTLKGQVTGQGAGALVMAEVQVLGSGERAFTDALGNYALSGIETGGRKIGVTARGFKSTTQTVTVSPAGAEVTQNFALVP